MADLRVGVGAVRPECLKVIDWASDMVARRRAERMLERRLEGKMQMRSRGAVRV